MEILPYGENGLRLVFGTAISVAVSKEVRKAHSFLKAASPPGVIDIIPSFTTCLVIFDNTVTSFDYLSSFLKERESAIGSMQVGPPAHHDIPVRYGGEYGPDLDFVCSYSGLTEDEVISTHTGSIYTVFAIGFLPGFPYLGPLDVKLFTPRLQAPRLKVAEGSVGIAQLQTGIYPFDSPGGWRIIGKTEMKLFDWRTPPYSALKMGDQVRFVRTK